MAGTRISWTEQQQRAIAARGRNVLVTASAGTGKTAVLSGRCVDIVSDVALSPDVLDMLVLTFTEAAAEQMRSRIAGQLRDAYQRTHDPRLGRQLVLLQGADISTIHSFCKRLITENFHALSLDPTFRVIDADEAMLLKVEVLNETVEWAWQQEDAAGRLQSLLRRRDLRESSGFLNHVIQLSQFLDGVVSARQWCEHACDLAAESVDSRSSELGQAQKQLVRDRLIGILAQLRGAYRLHESEAPGGRWGAELSEKISKPIGACLDRIEAGDWQGGVEAILYFEKPRAPALKGLPEATGNLIKELRTKALADFVGLRDLAVVNPDYLNVVGQTTSLQSRVLIELTVKFRQLYAGRKMALNGLDFADLEHYALRLLAEEDTAHGQRRPSETALALRERYRYIFVDEYQDINPVQQAILDALGSGDNVFVVGDIKQSIYAWRGAEPTIFLQRLQAAAAQAEPTSGLRVDLNTNFRSAVGILDFVNKVFGRIMVASVANIDYDKAARLRPAAAEEVSSAPTPIVELHVLDEKAREAAAQEGEDADEGGNGTDAVDPRQRHAALIARRIKEIVGAETDRAELQIYDRDAEAFRDAQYRDIVVLMRSLAKKANDYVEVLRLAGIPVSSDATAGYFETTEITDIVSLLKVLDNPLRDIEFAAVLRSPLFKLSDTELAEIRLAESARPGRVNLYSRTVHYRNDGPDAALKGKLRRVLDTLDRWRTLARRGWLADLLWRIYRDTQYLASVCALPNGQARKANLLKLHDRAVQFEGFASSAGVPSLTRFVEFIEKLQETGQDWTPAAPAGAAGNAVRLLSVHKSKGLEFPVVFLAELDSEFNQRDVQADLVMDAEHTLGLQVIEPHSNAKLRSLAHQVIGEKRRAVTLAEEMRILYVAMTRAKDRLILTASQKRTGCAAILAKGLLLSDETVPDWLLRSCKNPLEWVMYGLADQRSLHAAFDTGLAEKARDDALFSLSLHGADALLKLSQEVVTLRKAKAKPCALVGRRPHASQEAAQRLQRVKERLAWRYPFADAVHQPAKQSVTGLTHQGDEFARLDYARALERRPAALAATAPPDARLIGAAVHLVIASLDLAQPVTAGAVEKMIEALLAQGALTPSVAEGIDAGAVAAFFESELGSMVLDQRNTVWREWPFTFGLPTSQAPDGVIVVQGIIDMLVQTPEGLLVIDFKTDRVTGPDVARRAEAYRGQVELYARAAGGILDQPVRAGWLYFLAARQVVQV